MARRTRKLTKAEKEQRRQRREDEDLANVVADMAGRFTCTVELARDFAGQCRQRATELDFDLSCCHIASEFWSGRPGRGQRAVDLLAQLAAEHQRYRDAIADLAHRLTAFAEEVDDGVDNHEHLEPVEPYRARIRHHLYPDL